MYYIGECIQTTRGGHVHTFQYEMEDCAAPQRNSDEFYLHAKEAIETGLPVSERELLIVVTPICCLELAMSRVVVCYLSRMDRLLSHKMLVL